MLPRPPTSTLFPYTTLFRSFSGMRGTNLVQVLQQGFTSHATGAPAAQPQIVRGCRVMGSGGDRKSTRLNSSHRCISYAVFCLKKKKKREIIKKLNKQKQEQQ